MASIPDPPALGTSTAGTGGIDEYAVGAVIRQGWGGTIHEGEYLRTGRRVTVQEVRPDLVASPGLIERLGGLGREAAALRDPHLLAVYDLVGGEGGWQLIAEWSEGNTLASALRTESMRPAQAIAVIRDILAGLEVLHVHGLFHGAVGPETVVVDGDGRARLAELSLCAAAAPPGFGAHTDVHDAARLGLHLLRKAGSRVDPVRRVLTRAASDAAGVGDARSLRAELDRAATAALGAGWQEQRGTSTRRRPERAGRRQRVVLIPMGLLLLAGVVVAVILLVGRGASAISSGPLTLGGDAKLVGSPASGGCNTTFTFVGSGSLSGKGTLVYRWEQSDGQASADTSLPISPDEGSFRLNQAWRLEGSQKVDGTMTLHIVKPVDRKLSQAFHYSCP